MAVTNHMSKSKPFRGLVVLGGLPQNSSDLRNDIIVFSVLIQNTGLGEAEMYSWIFPCHLYKGKQHL